MIKNSDQDAHLRHITHLSLIVLPVLSPWSVSIVFRIHNVTFDVPLTIFSSLYSYGAYFHRNSEVNLEMGRNETTKIRTGEVNFLFLRSIFQRRKRDNRWNVN